MGYDREALNVRLRMHTYEQSSYMRIHAFRRASIVSSNYKSLFLAAAAFSDEIIQYAHVDNDAELKRKIFTKAILAEYSKSCLFSYNFYNKRFNI